MTVDEEGCSAAAYTVMAAAGAAIPPGLGRSLKPILDAMQDWGREYQHSFRLEQEKPR